MKKLTFFFDDVLSTARGANYTLDGDRSVAPPDEVFFSTMAGPRLAAEFADKWYGGAP
jgi:hypothetical protein